MQDGAGPNPVTTRGNIMTTIHIEGRRWFQRAYGNTYNTVRIFIDGRLAVELPISYGYGDYYIQRAHDWLGENGFPELAERHANGMPAVNTTIWLRENGGSYSVIDVQRKKDL